MQQAEDPFVEDSYTQEIANIPSSSKRQIKLLTSRKTGVDEVDIEILVIRRALQRISTHAKDPAVVVDVDVVNSAIERLVVAVKAHQVDPFSVEAPSPQPSAKVQPNSLTPSKEIMFYPSAAFQVRQRQTATKLVAEQKAANEFRALRNRALGGLWGTILRIASYAVGDYNFRLESEVPLPRAHSLFTEAKAVGLTSLARLLSETAHPCLTVRGIRLPSGTLMRGDGHPLPAGIVAYLTQRKRQVTCASSSVWGKLERDSILERNLKPFMTMNSTGSFVSIDFGGTLVCPSAYGFASVHNILPGYFPLHWQLLGSLDGERWELLKEHSGQCQFFGKVPHCLWKIDLSKQHVYRSFKILNLGPNSSGGEEFQISSFEMYGSVTFAEDVEKKVLEGCKVEARPRGFVPVQPPPDIATLLKKGKKK